MSKEIIFKPNFQTDEDGRKRFNFFCEGCDCIHLFVLAKGKIDSPIWTWNGNETKPSFEPSLLYTWDEGEARTPKRCHLFLRHGQIQYLDDCTHHLKGKTVPVHGLIGCCSLHSKYSRPVSVFFKA